MIVVITGAPGAGKGTQGDLLVDRLGFRKVSTGDALRRQIKLGTPLGIKVDAVMRAGQLVSDELLQDILSAELGSNPDERILLDGYPRNISQAESLDQSRPGGHRVACVVHLDVDQQELVRRLSGRRLCGSCERTIHIGSAESGSKMLCESCGGSLVQRPDDHPDKVKVRLAVYEEVTQPILGYYRKHGLYHRVNGVGTEEEIYEQMAALLKPLAK